MTKIAFMFPGQGSQRPGMGRDIHDASSAARAAFRTADDVLGESLSKTCFEGSADALARTETTQPAVLITSIALLWSLEAHFDVAVGHSLGEFTAHVAAGTMSLEHAVALTRSRGRFMQEVVPEGGGAMTAVVGASAVAVERICADTRGIVEPVTYNGGNQIVIAGERGPVSRATSAIEKLGARCRPLRVSAPFHSTLMRPAERRLTEAMRELRLRTPRRPVYANVDTRPVDDADSARRALLRQTSRPVLWEGVVRRLVADGVALFVEIGPGTTLTGLVRRIDPSVATRSVQYAEDIAPARAAIEDVLRRRCTSECTRTPNQLAS